MRSRPLRIAAVVALLLIAAACGDDDAADTSADDFDPLSTTIGPPDLDGPLPPVDAINIAPLFEEDLTELGLRLTNRGGLIDRSDGGYVKNGRGTHYALYVEPIGDDYTLDDFAENLTVLTALTGPVLFERYPDLESYDICQEPRAADDPSPYPPPATQIEFSRAHIESVDDWDGFDLDELLRLRDEGGRVVVSETVATHPLFAGLDL